MNNNIQQVEYDELRERYNQLAFTQEIPDMAAYALEWLKLSADAEAGNRPALAGMCSARAEHYGELAGGAYIRLIEGSFSEVLQV